MASPWGTPEHDAFRDSVRRFVAEQITPSVPAWEEAQSFPRSLYEAAGALGILGIGFPESYGGTPADPFYSLIVIQELARAGSGGVSASLMSHTIGAPPIVAAGSEELKQRVLPRILAGHAISALAVTEPGGGSDVAAVRTKAILEGDHYRLSGEKVFITSGIRADYLTTLVRTGGEGMDGLTLLLVEDAPGLTRMPMQKMGWHPSDTATLRFDNVSVPVGNRLGNEGDGFRIAMRVFNAERLGLAANAAAFADVCLEDAIAWASQRRTFGKRLVEHQVIRHKLADMATRIAASTALVESLAWRVGQGEMPVAEIAMAKNHATVTMAYCASEAVQILGGAGYVRGSRAERVYREVKVNAIGGGTEEILKDLIAKKMGWN